MGTRSLTYVFGEECKPIVCVYRQFDGYPSGHGEDLKSILSGIPVVNGIPVKSENRLFNGMEELAAVLVQRLKEECPRGNIYLIPPVWPPEERGQDFVWVVTGKVGECASVYYYCTSLDDKWHHWFGPRADWERHKAVPKVCCNKIATGGIQ
ncbi:hypothetical protein DRO59_08600 [Candidatus Bathyarchaeota archaeon]|nr:MAG: hypothetical protein DRO59_08600 [Candidatus Bathyarchaeota archaeon]